MTIKSNKRGRPLGSTRYRKEYDIIFPKMARIYIAEPSAQVMVLIKKSTERDHVPYTEYKRILRNWNKEKVVWIDAANRKHQAMREKTTKPMTKKPIHTLASYQESFNKLNSQLRLAYSIPHFDFVMPRLSDPGLANAMRIHSAIGNSTRALSEATKPFTDFKKQLSAINIELRPFNN